MIEEDIWQQKYLLSDLIRAGFRPHFVGRHNNGGNPYYLLALSSPEGNNYHFKSGTEPPRDERNPIAYSNGKDIEMILESVNPRPKH